MWARIEEPSQCNCIQFDLEEFWLHYKLISRQIVDLKRTLEEKGQTYLEIFYEELVGSERECVLERLCDFLEVKRLHFDLEAVIFKRQNPFALSEIVTNYDEVKKALAGTEAEWMVKDG